MSSIQADTAAAAAAAGFDDKKCDQSVGTSPRPSNVVSSTSSFSSPSSANQQRQQRRGRGQGQIMDDDQQSDSLQAPIRAPSPSATTTNTKQGQIMDDDQHSNSLQVPIRAPISSGTTINTKQEVGLHYLPDNKVTAEDMVVPETQQRNKAENSVGGSRTPPQDDKSMKLPEGKEYPSSYSSWSSGAPMTTTTRVPETPIIANTTAKPQHRVPLRHQLYKQDSLDDIEDHKDEKSSSSSLDEVDSSEFPGVTRVGGGGHSDDLEEEYDNVLSLSSPSIVPPPPPPLPGIIAELVDDNEMEHNLRRRWWEELRTIAPRAVVVVEETRTEENTEQDQEGGSRGRKKFIRVFLVGLVILIAIAVIAAIVASTTSTSTSNRENAEDSSSEDLVPTTTNSIMPTTKPTEQLLLPTIPPTNFLFWSSQQLGNILRGETYLDHFGRSVSLSADGTTLAVGAILNDENGGDSGRVQVFTTMNHNTTNADPHHSSSSTRWTQIGQNILGDAPGDVLGISVSLSANGKIIALSAFGNDIAGLESGVVRVYALDKTNTWWTQMGDDILGANAGDEFGWSVSLSSDGTVVAAGARYNNDNGFRSGHARVFQYVDDGTNWAQRGQVLVGDGSGDEFGYSISLSGSGSVLVVGGPRNDADAAAVDSGHIRAYAFNGTDWEQLGRTIKGEIPGDLFGRSVALSMDGATIASAAFRSNGLQGQGFDSGKIRVFRFTEGTWIPIGQSILGRGRDDEFGASVALSQDGMILAAGAVQQFASGGPSGYVRVFHLDEDEGVWNQLGDDLNGIVADDDFGASVSLSADGLTVAVGAPQFLTAGDFNSVVNNTGYARVYFAPSN